jgi:putative chitinase
MLAKCPLVSAVSMYQALQPKWCEPMSDFFSVARSEFGSLKQGQVDGMNVLLSETTGLPLHWRAYILATAWHETAFTMQPIVERGGVRYFDQYDPAHNPKKARALGNTVKGDGYRFRGRGYVQITGRANYHKAGLLCGVDMVLNPDLALKPDIAAKVIVRGMSDGMFTGKKLAGFTNYADMRRIVNGTDKAKTIAGYAEKFEKALRAQELAPAPLPHSPAPTMPPIPETPSAANPEPSVGLLKAFLSFLAFLFMPKKG